MTLSCILCIAIQSNLSGKICGEKVSRSKRPPDTIIIQLPSFSDAVERMLNAIEKTIVSTAEAMPEDKFYFTPENLEIKGSEFKGVRSFGAQVMHIAADNFLIWSSISADSVRSDIKDINGPENIKTKAETIKLLKESFSFGRKAISTLTEKNAMDIIPFRGNNVPRLTLAFCAIVHANEHYGQMAVYMRMCGIIPPVSRRANK